jgi:hypothetical protein
VKRWLGLVAAGLLASAMLPPLHAATEPGAGDTRHHLEACTKWSARNGHFGFQSECSEPVAVLLVELNGARRFDHVLQPNERFDIDLPEKTVNETGWLFTACPAGTVPNVPFTAEQQSRIVRSQYECVRK